MDMTPHDELVAHEKLCAERYDTIHHRLDRIENMLNKLIWGIMAGFGAIVVAVVMSTLH
jgi:ribosome assembly protein YihI (activator of Der GTPase)